MTIKYLYLLILIIVFGCKDEIVLNNKNFEPRMVVDGIITDESRPYIIKLMLTSPTNKSKEIPYSGCTITLIDNTGNSEILTEIKPGTYSTSESGIQGIIGKSYRITISTSDGREYATEFQEMKESVEIDSVHAELIKKESLDYVYGLPGYQFYVDTKTASNKENYFLWRMIETFEYSADYPLYAVIDKYGRFLIVGLDTCDLFYDFYWCWKTQTVGYLFTGKTSNLTIPQINKQELMFVGTDSRKLQKRYSLLLKQYSIGEEAYYFWKGIEEQTSQENFLVSNQPYNIVGNIKNVNNSDEAVYGYFTVASESQKRIFLDRPNNAFYYNICFVDYEPPYRSKYLVISEEGRLGAVDEGCLDCTTRGGETIKPDFWID